MASVDFDKFDASAALRREMARRLRRASRAVAARAAENAPRDTGALAGSYRAEDGPDEGRAVLVERVGTDYLHGRFVEIGTQKMAPRAPLRRALAESGDVVLCEIEG